MVLSFKKERSSFLSAREISEAVRGGRVSAEEVLRQHLAVVAPENPRLNAICTLDVEGALAAARAVDAGEVAGLLAGVPVGIKDVTETAGLRTTYGSALFAENVPAADAEIVRRLRAAGAVIVGKTNTPEFATGAHTTNALFGTTRNPLDDGLTAGGSTGGGAAALASGMIALAEGTDFGGSLRIPAAFCGVVGLRPTPGVVPTWPSPDPWDVGQVSGGMARDAEDLALMLRVVAGPCAELPVAGPVLAPARPVAGLRLRYAAAIAGVAVDAPVAEACRAAALELGAAETDFEVAESRDAYLTLRAAWMATRFGHLLGQEIGANLRGNIEAGLALRGSEMAEARRGRAAAWQRWCALFRECDALLTPTVAVLPFAATQSAPDRPGSYIDWAAQTFVVSLVGLPAVSVPCEEPMVGLQIIGPPGSDLTLLGIAEMVTRGR